jgi:hypothetical protein
VIRKPSLFGHSYFLIGSQTTPFKQVFLIRNCEALVPEVAYVGSATELYPPPTWVRYSAGRWPSPQLTQLSPVRHQSSLTESRYVIGCCGLRQR